MSALVADLRSAFPASSIVFFAGRSNLEATRLLDGVNQVVEIPTNNLAAGLKAIRSIAVDVMLDFGQWSRLEALLSLFSKASFTVGFQTLKQYRHYAYDFAVRHSCEVHELENFRLLVRSLGVKTWANPTLVLREMAAGPVCNFAVFHLWPGGLRSELKQWPAERWLRLIEQFVSWGMKVVLTGAPSDHGRNEVLIGRVRSGVRGFVKNAAGLDIERTAATLARSQIVVSVNTGVMHMAAALDIPLVALHGPTSSNRWGPVSEKVVVVDSPLAGCGYLSLGWEYPLRPLPCMECIDYELVYEACRKLLEKRNSSHQSGLTNRSCPALCSGLLGQGA
jgi:ADP-heptose:LPS heptosyltransferase